MNCQVVFLGVLWMRGFVYHHVIIQNHIATYNVRISTNVIRRKKILTKTGSIK